MSLAAWAAPSSMLGIEPLDTLADVKAKWPNAQWQEVQKATEAEPFAMWTMAAGAWRGMGTLVVYFQDTRWQAKSMLQQTSESVEQPEWRQAAQATDDDALVIDSMTLVLQEAMPLKALVKQYGRYDATMPLDDGQGVYAVWHAKGMRAVVSDASQQVEQIDFVFTPEDIGNAYRRNGQEVPPDIEAAMLAKHMRKTTQTPSKHKKPMAPRALPKGHMPLGKAPTAPPNVATPSPRTNPRETLMLQPYKE
jgi:hypothetical protein